ncbi:methylated-dna--[protein]-cysteine s-methyltransferase [Lactobacillus selangorensis]|uniref:methylated-DNA--[protein]-cysteine S-methyltransferase n=1 Tax=Lactobacillus selangorensis TaxID=81857 RepID=A0A0R2FH72_9LACO|nr:methylated-DNA--[protein]-cysteine S-methyltransferase [Lactobacillus selangorensis]KRN27598.1 methylated-dna--[protein]-cysteine s-methyltransferase [Lactobacillus selangorensis]KRN30128.1 methylated-dna--[protein]-cysteine s-methyltransferase [Lactobacillus selangorensis]
MTTVYTTQFSTHGHTFWLGTTLNGLCFVGSPDASQNEMAQFLPADTTYQLDRTHNEHALNALDAYWNGQSQSFDLPLDFLQGTLLRKQVWQALQTIPYGQTVTYTELAEQSGHSDAVRAVASAVGKNPLLIVVPCHRVLRKDGSLGGYRGGEPMKKTLLALEQH